MFMLISILIIGIILFYVFNKIMDRTNKTSTAISMLGIEITLIGGILYNIEQYMLILSFIGLVLLLVGFFKDEI